MLRVCHLVACFLSVLFAMNLMNLMNVMNKQSLTGDREIDDRDYDLKQLMEGERFTPLFKVRVPVPGLFLG